MTKRRPARAQILSPSFVWHGSQTHDADSTAFRERQRQRIAQMQGKPAPVASVAQIKRKA